MAFEKEESRSPIKRGLLRRLPGQSVFEEQLKLYEQRVEEPLMLAAAVLLVGAVEAVAGFGGWRRFPELGVVAAVGALAYMLWIVFRVRPQMRALRLGHEGERAVGQFLEGLRAAGYRVFHDIPGDGFNVDHVLIGPTGVYTIETKTWSLPARGRPTIDFDGESLRIAGKNLDSNPVHQARAQASWLGELLAESTRRKYPIQPVVLLPGWYIRKTKRIGRAVWVLNPRALPAFLRCANEVLSDEMQGMASVHLSRYVQTFK